MYYFKEKVYRNDALETIIIGTFLRDGAALSNYFLKMADKFVDLGYRVIIIADEDRKNLVDTVSNPMILTWPSYHPTKWKDFIFLKQLIEKYQVKMMISNFNTVNFFLLAGAISGVPNRVAWKHTLSEQFRGETPIWKHWRKGFIYKLATQIIVNSEATKRDAMELYRVNEKKITVLPNLIANNDEYINKDKEFKIVFVGRFHETKGVDILIKALSIVKDEFPTIKLELIAGGEQAKYIKLVEKYNLQNNVEFLGRLPMKKVLEHFAKAQFSVVPSLAEAFGYIVIESFSVKTPVIGSDTGGIAEIIEDNKSGLLFPVGDHNALAAKIKFLLNNEEIRDRYAENAYLRFNEKYSLDNNIGKVAKMFHQHIEDGN